MSDIKIHFALSRAPLRDLVILRTLGVNYILSTAYPWPDKPIREWQYYGEFKHVIVDSGLFTIMFGAQGNRTWDYKDIRGFLKKYMNTIRLMLQTWDCLNTSFVDFDTQRIIGCEKTDDLRKELYDNFPTLDFIHPYHIPDGRDGLDYLIDTYDHLAISVPELRINAKHGAEYYVKHLTEYAMNRKPSLRIHELGCTQMKALRHVAHLADTADSSTWSQGLRFGRIGARHCSQLKPEAYEQVHELLRPAAELYKFKTLSANMVYGYLQAKYVFTQYKNLASQE